MGVIAGGEFLQRRAVDLAGWVERHHLDKYDVLGR
jgi:hypothetical protein